MFSHDIDDKTFKLNQLEEKSSNLLKLFKEEIGILLDIKEKVNNSNYSQL